jgi:hypothetical protein
VRLTVPATPGRLLRATVTGATQEHLVAEAA